MPHVEHGRWPVVVLWARAAPSCPARAACGREEREEGERGRKKKKKKEKEKEKGREGERERKERDRDGGIRSGDCVWTSTRAGRRRAARGKREMER